MDTGRGIDVDTGERGGAAGVEAALAWIAMLGLLGAVVQIALLFYAGQLALTAAETGAGTGRHETRPAVAAEEATRAFLNRAGGTALVVPSVAADLGPDGAVLRVRVTGQALSLMPGVTLTVDKSAVAAVERVAP